jgi:hypothetical protein
LTTTPHIAQKIKVRGIQPTCFDSTLLTLCDPFEPAIKIECDSVDDTLLRYVDELSAANGQRNYEHEVVQAGIEGLRKYGIGPCSARWFYGSFDIFIQLERRLAACTLAFSPSLVNAEVKPIP